MKKIFLLYVIFVILGCAVFEEEKSISAVRVLVNGIELNTITIQEGQTLELRAVHDSNAKDVSITWETQNENAVIASSGIGTVCTIKGMKSGSSTLTVKAWKGSDTPITKNVNIMVNTAALTGVEIAGPNVIAIGEAQEFTAAPVPQWATGNFTWSATPAGSVTLTGTGNTRTVTGVIAGTVTLRAAQGAVSRDFNLEVKQSATPADLKIFNGTINVTGGTISVGPYEDINLRAEVTAQNPNDFIFVKWVSANPANVAVDSSGMITGLSANTTAIITVSVGGMSKTVTVTVTNPVTGIRINYNSNNAGEQLPVTNIIWLEPGESVTLTANIMRGDGTADSSGVSINWGAGNSEVSVSPTGTICTLTGGASSYFDDLPTELHITAGNSDNGGRPASTVVLVKTQAPPIWAWDRARDGVGAGFPTGNGGQGIGVLSGGRGTNTNAATMRVRVFGNNITYNESGLKINSSNSNGGNPDPVAGNPANSTRIAIGNDGPSTYDTDNRVPVHQPGDFNFLEAFATKAGGVYTLKPEAENKTIRISVDYEISWSAGAGRDMWIMMNNNNANAAQSILNTTSQLLVEPLTAARGTRATAVAYVDVNDLVRRNVTGLDTLETAFICIIALSNGGSIYVSGIRIEYEE